MDDCNDCRILATCLAFIMPAREAGSPITDKLLLNGVVPGRFSMV
jgi:hypothetical protein